MRETAIQITRQLIISIAETEAELFRLNLILDIQVSGRRSKAADKTRFWCRHHRIRVMEMKGQIRALAEEFGLDGPQIP